jgi:hypothetical protein
MGAAAANYATAGITVFPLWWTTPTSDGTRHCACSDGTNCGSPGKHPRTGRGGVHLATTDPHRITLWWAQWPDANIGVPAGANNLAVLDVDPRHGGDDTLATLVDWADTKHGIDLLATRTVRTGSGGLHLLYQAPPGGIKSAARAFGADGLDTRGRGGYIVAPPSLHVSGGRYENVDTGHPLAPWPAILTRLMNPPAPAPATGNTQPVRAKGGTAWARAALDAECTQLRNMTSDGSRRNDALNIAAYKIGRRVGAGLLDEREASDALYAAASGWHGHGERELRATIASGMRGGIARPHTGPAAKARADA